MVLTWPSSEQDGDVCNQWNLDGEFLARAWLRGTYCC
jgi:hypothetical protein